MSGRIPQNFIDDLLVRTNIVDLIDGFVPLKKKGANYSACCPFHDEKTPSFTVSEDKQFYHCFGCGAHGSAIGFLMEYSNLDFVEAIEELAARAGIDVVRENDGMVSTPKRELMPLFELNQQVCQFYQRQLKQHVSSSVATNYLKQRGVSGQVAKTFGIGFAPPGWDNVLKNFGHTTEQQAQLQELGLIVSNDNNKTYDRFRERIVFPIRNKKGQTVGFGGRVLDDGVPKYLNSPETPLYHKGREIYGLYEALQSTSKLQRLILVEGYLDVLALHQSGLPNVVAALGTAITREHVDLLFRSVSELVICLDGDSAGQKAAWRAVVNALPALKSGRQIKVLMLPDGEDPDSLVRAEGAEQFEQRIEQATPLSTYFFDYLAKTHSLSNMEGRAGFMEQARPLLETLPDSTFSTMMKKQLAEITQMEADPPSFKQNQRSSLVSRKKGAGNNKRSPSVLRYVITALLHEPMLASKIKEGGRWIDESLPGMALLKNIIDHLHERPDMSAAMLLERYRGGEYERTLESLLQVEKLMDGESSLAEFEGAIQRLQEQANARRLEILLDKARLTALTSLEQDELKKLLK